MFNVLKDFFVNLFKLWLYYWLFLMMIIVGGYIVVKLIGVIY